MLLLRAYFQVLFSAQSWREVAYLLLGLPLGVLWGTYGLTMYATGYSLVIVWVGAPLVFVTHWTMKRIGRSELALVNGLLQSGIPSPASSTRGPMQGGRQQLTLLVGLRMVAGERQVWNAFAWTVIRLVTGPVGFAIAVLALVAPLSLAGSIVVAAVSALGWVANTAPAGAQGTVDTATFWILVGSAVLIFLMPTFMWLSRAFASLHVVMARWLLGPCKADVAAAATARAERAEEQVRIDQELHDSIGHMITMNVIQAGAGAHVFDTDPQFARQALKNIEERGRAAMGELDRIVASLRGDAPETTAPLPSINDITGLIDNSRAAGMDITASIGRAKVPDAVGRAAFGIVREALTNAAKHAPGAAVSVAIELDGDALGIAIDNDAPPNSARSGALAAKRASAKRRGVSGMRDRVTLLGGYSSIGPRKGGGFSVVALIPVDAVLAADGEPGSRWAPLREKVNA